MLSVPCKVFHSFSRFLAASVEWWLGSWTVGCAWWQRTKMPKATPEPTDEKPRSRLADAPAPKMVGKGVTAKVASPRTLVGILERASIRFADEKNPAPKLGKTAPKQGQFVVAKAKDAKMVPATVSPKKVSRDEIMSTFVESPSAVIRKGKSVGQGEPAPNKSAAVAQSTGPEKKSGREELSSNAMPSGYLPPEITVDPRVLPSGSSLERPNADALFIPGKKGHQQSGYKYQPGTGVGVQTAGDSLFPSISSRKFWIIVVVAIVGIVLVVIIVIAVSVSASK